MTNKRIKGKKGEEIAKQHYLDQGYTLIKENFTIRGGEIDLLMKKGRLLSVIEVKNLDSVNDFNNYIHPKKLWHLEKTLACYLQTINEHQFDEISIDAVFVQHGRIIEIYHNITTT